jgi:hypothetical protein
MNLFLLLQNTTQIPSLLSFRKENAGLMDCCAFSVGVSGFNFWTTWQNFTQFSVRFTLLYAISAL